MIVEYAGGMRFVARHRGLEVMSDEPADEGGQNTAMTPAELFVASLGMCVAVYVVGFAVRHSIAVQGLSVEVDYQIAEAPRRVGQIRRAAELRSPAAGEGEVASARQCPAPDGPAAGGGAVPGAQHLASPPGSADLGGLGTHPTCAVGARTQCSPASGGRVNSRISQSRP